MSSTTSSSEAGDGPDAPADSRHPHAITVGLLVAGAVIVLDQATKQLAERSLERGRFVPLVGEHVGWQLVYNPGVSFGIRAPVWLPLIVTVIVIVIVARALPRTARLLPAFSYGFLLAGAIGNVLDRLFRAREGGGFGSGEVVDFVAWGSFPRFNVADSAITIGFVLLVLALWQEERDSGSDRDEVPSPDEGRPDEGRPTEGRTDEGGSLEVDADRALGPDEGSSADPPSEP